MLAKRNQHTEGRTKTSVKRVGKYMNRESNCPSDQYSEIHELVGRQYKRLVKHDHDAACGVIDTGCQWMAVGADTLNNVESLPQPLQVDLCVSSLVKHCHKNGFQDDNATPQPEPAGADSSTAPSESFPGETMGVIPYHAPACTCTISSFSPGGAGSEVTPDQVYAC